MKKYILIAGVLGVFSLFAGCSSSDKSPLAPVDEGGTAVESSSSEKEPSSAENKGKSSSSAKATSSEDKGSTAKDTATIHEQVFIVDSNALAKSSYVSSGIFCWNEGCEKDFPSSSSAAPASSETITITISSASAEPPVINGENMTDKRDDKNYKLKTIGGKLWMAQDLNYEAGSSKCFKDDDSNCAKYGRLYTFAAASHACPAGWRLPNRDEAQAALNDESVPWSYGGRCKNNGDCDFTEQMGFHWTTATPQENDKNYAQNQGEGFAVIIVEKEPEYAGENADKKFFQVDDKSKFFSVRCVQE